MISRAWTSTLEHATQTEPESAAMPAPITPGGEPTDDIFAEARPRTPDFAFDASTVRVFDNMVNRSVPFYGEIQRMTAELSREFAVPGSAVYDLGCSTGTSLMALEAHLDPSIDFVGYDNAPDMVERAKELAPGRAQGVQQRCVLDLRRAGADARGLAPLPTVGRTSAAARGARRGDGADSDCVGGGAMAQEEQEARASSARVGRRLTRSIKLRCAARHVQRVRTRLPLMPRRPGIRSRLSVRVRSHDSRMETRPPRRRGARTPCRHPAER